MALKKFKNKIGCTNFAMITDDIYFWFRFNLHYRSWLYFSLPRERKNVSYQPWLQSAVHVPLEEGLALFAIFLIRCLLFTLYEKHLLENHFTKSNASIMCFQFLRSSLDRKFKYTGDICAYCLHTRGHICDWLVQDKRGIPILSQ